MYLPLLNGQFMPAAPTHLAKRRAPVVIRAATPSASGSNDDPGQRILVPRTPRRAPTPEPEEFQPPAQRDARYEQREDRYSRDSGSKEDWRGGQRRDRRDDDRGRDWGRDRAFGDRDRGWGRERGQGEHDGRRDFNRGDRDRDRRERYSNRPTGPVWQPDPATLRSPRYLALRQLLRIEEGGAFVGLVNGSPGSGPQPLGRDGSDDDDDEEGFGRQRGDSGSPSREEEPLDPRDQRLIKELVAGVTRMQRRLDYTASKLTNQTPADLEAGVRLVLRLGLFELTERRLAPHALNEHVQLAKALVRPDAGAFVNGVLRSAVRHMEADTLPTPETEPSTSGKASSGRETLRRLAIQHSHPNWLVSRWLQRFGQEDTVALLKHNNTPPVYTVRINTLRPGATAAALLEQLVQAGVEAEPSPYLPEEFIRINSGLQRLLAQGFVSSGSLFVQDESAGLVVSLLDPQPGERLLDCCAAPGGKTLFAAARMRGRGSITALDVSAPRLQALRRAADVAGVSSMVTTHSADLRQWAERVAGQESWQEEMRSSGSEREPVRGGVPGGGRRPRIRQPESLLYDKVLLDAPCTGTGVLSKRADLRWRRTPEQLDQLVGLQGDLLEAAARLVLPGGVLVYSTCSVEAEEDQERVYAFLDRHPEFEVEAPPAAAAAGGTAGAVAAADGPGGWMPAEVLTAEGFLATLPHLHNTDGAFAARLRRSNRDI